MKMKIFVVALFAMLSVSAFAQNDKKSGKVLPALTYEILQSFKTWDDPEVRYSSYTASDGHTYKVGDTIEIGTSANEHYYKYYSQGDGVLLSYTPMPSKYSGDKVIIRSIRVEGGKRKGFIVWMRVSNASLTASQINNFEGALREGEVVSQGMTRQAAIAKLKEYKEMRELGLITDEEYDQKRDELRDIIRRD